jgi:hypothetical protein
MNELEKFFTESYARHNEGRKGERTATVVEAGEMAPGGYPYVIAHLVWSDRVKREAPSLTDHYCGYIGTTTRLESEDIEGLDVHGGVTFDQNHFDLLIIGFDTAHFDDDRPEIQNLDYVRGQLQGLADQLAEMNAQGIEVQS